MKLDANEKKILNNLGISALVLFGSQAQGSANEASDYDFFVIGQKKQKTYDALYEMLSEKINKLTDIDIVFDESAPMELKNHVSKYGKVLFQKDDATFPDFRQKVMMEYSDFAPLRTMFSNATLARIN